MTKQENEKLTDITCIVPKEQVRKAAGALVQYVKKKEEQCQSLMGEVEGQDVQLQLIFRKVPRTKNVKIKIGLPTSPVGDTKDICLFVKDINKKERDHEPTSRHYKELLCSKGVKNISEVIPLKALKLEYQPFEAKRNLSNMYDVYLADARIMRLLPSVLGKHFYSRKRYPIQVNLGAKDLQKEVKKALHTTQCVITGRGSSCLTPVGHTGLTEVQLTDNIIKAIQTLGEKIPGGVANIHSLHIKTPDSPAIPLYICFTSGKNIEMPQKPAPIPLDEPEDVTTVQGAKVRVTPAGDIELFPYSDEDEEDDEGKDESKPAKLKRKVILGKRKPKSKRKRAAKANDKKATSNNSEPEPEVKEEESVKAVKSFKAASKAKSLDGAKARKTKRTEESDVSSPAKKARVQTKRRKTAV